MRHRTGRERSSSRLYVYISVLACAVTSCLVNAQVMPVELIPGTWALEPDWPALQSADEATVRAAFGGLLQSVDDPLNDPEGLTIERALSLALYFQDHAPDLPCAAILEEMAAANLPQAEIEAIADGVHWMVGCPDDGFVDPNDVSERPIWSPFRPGYAWCADSNSDGVCDAWFNWYYKPSVSDPLCCWNCIANGVLPNGEIGCLLWEHVDCGQPDCGAAGCQAGSPCDAPPPLWDDTIEPSVGRPDRPPMDQDGGGLEGSNGGSNGDDGGFGGGGPGGGHDSGTTDGGVADAAAGDGSQNADLEQHATTVSTCNPVLVSDGFKIEKEVDLVVSLPGRDFKLYRTYNGSHLVRNDSFPWAMGSGWGTSADAWICYRSRGLYLNESPLGDMVDLTIFPVEESTQYLDPIPNRTSGTPEYLAAIGAGDSRFRQSIRVDPTGAEFGVYILESPGRGHSVFVRAPSESDNMHELDGRLIEQRDEYDNIWKFEYSRFTYPSGVESKPRLYRILLGGETPTTAQAVVYFKWYLGDENEPGTGKLKAVHVARRYQRTLAGGRIDENVIVTHRVKYTYLSNLEKLDDENQQSLYEHLYAGRIDDPVLVEQSVLVNAPTLEPDLGSRLDEPSPLVYQTRYWHYRYGYYDGHSKMQTIDLVFEPSTFEHLAAELGCDLDDAVEMLLQTDKSDAFQGATQTPMDFVSKAINYYGASDAGDGYRAGELAGRVRRQVLRSGCSCGGGSQLSRSEHFRYAKRAVPLPEWQVTSFTIIRPTRESRLTERTDCIWNAQGPGGDLFAEENWLPQKVARSWSEEVEIVRGLMISPGGSFTAWKSITAPFVIADQIVELVGSQRSAASVHLFELDRTQPGAFQRVLRLHSEAIAGFDTYQGEPPFADGLLAFDCESGENAYDAVTWVGSNSVSDGLAEWWVYDEESRLTDYGVARGWALDDGALRKPALANLPTSARHLKHHDYVPAERLAGLGPGALADDEIWFTRSDLLAATTEYLDGGAITKSFAYLFHDPEVTHSSTDPADHWFPRVSLQVTSTAREGGAQDGPGGSVCSWRAFSPKGEILWDLDEEGTATAFAYEPLTGHRVSVTRNATQLSTMPSDVTDGFGTGLPPMPAFDASNAEGELTSSVVYDLAGRPVRTMSETGVTHEVQYRLCKLPQSTRKFADSSFVPYGWSFPVLMVVGYPHELPSGTFDGPVTIQWADADLNLLRVSTYEASSTFGFDAEHGYPDSNSVERSRAVHVYSRSGMVEQSILYPMVGRTNGLLNGADEDAFALVQRFEYDAFGQLARQIDSEGVYTDTAYDVFGRPVSTARGRLDGANAVDSSWLYYDAVVDQAGPESPDAEGKPSLVVMLIDDLPGTSTDRFRSVRTIYDWQRRPRLTFTLDTDARPDSVSMQNAAAGMYEVSVLDRLGRPTDTFNIAGGDMSGLIAALEADTLDVAWVHTHLGTRIASHVRIFYSPRGLVHRTEEAIDPTGQSSLGWLATRTWFDDLGRPLMTLGPNGPVTRTYFDRLGRSYRSEVRDGATARGSSADLDGVLAGDDDVVLESVESHFDPDTGLPWLAQTSRRRHDATDVGLDDDPVVSYAGTAYDEAARPIGTVDFGVNTGGEIFESGGTAPSQAAIEEAIADAIEGERSPETRVTLTLYDTLGRADRVIDPEGVVSMSLVDDLGRPIGVVANAEEFAATSDPIRLNWTSDPNVGSAGGYWLPSRSPEEVDQDVLTTIVYDRGGREHLKMALVGQSGAPITWTRQFTEFVYDPDQRTPVASDPLPNRAVLPGPLFEIRYPEAGSGAPGVYVEDGSAPSDVVRHGYNFAGEQIATEDQNHNLRQFSRDVAGRVLSDEVLAFGELARRAPGAGPESDPVSRWAESITTEYDSFARVAAVQTHDGNDSILNEVAYAYDSRGRLVELAQDTDGPVDDQSPIIGFTYHTTPYDSGADANHDRLTSIEYSDGTSVVNHYGQGSDDAISRIVSMRLDDEDIVSYHHLGLSTVAITDLGPIQSDRTVADDGKRAFGSNTAGEAGAYPGWDRFGRLRSLSWVDVDFSHDSGTQLPNSPPLVQWRYTWSPAGDLLSKQDARPGAQWLDRDRRHNYDDLHRLVESDVGLYTSFEEDQFDHAPARSEQWTLDSIGNWSVLATDTAGDGSFASEQSRAHNAANELITFDFDSNGQSEERRFYDDAGSLGLKQTHDGQAWSDGHRFLYDAWNRLVEVRDGGGAPVARYRYNALHWRTIAEKFSDGVIDRRERFTYSPQWQVLEQKAWETPTADPSQDGPPSWTAQHFWGKRAADDAVARRVDRDGAAGGGGSGGGGSGPDGDFDDPADGFWYYVTDHLRSVVAVVDRNGRLVERLDYSPFGKSQHYFAGDVNGDGVVNFFDVQHMLALTAGGAAPHIGDPAYEADADLNRDGVINFVGDILPMQADIGKTADGLSLSVTSGGPGNQVGYAGYWHLNDFGPHWYARHRIYDPAAGRWLTRDPAGYVDGLSLYLYVHGNPFGLVDPTGLGCADPEDLQWHHLYPQQVFGEGKIGYVEGLNINAAEHGRVFTQADHRGAGANAQSHLDWNNEWGKWAQGEKDAGRAITKESAEAQLRKMMDSEGPYAKWLSRSKLAEHSHGQWTHWNRNAARRATNKAAWFKSAVAHQPLIGRVARNGTKTTISAMRLGKVAAVAKVVKVVAPVAAVVGIGSNAYAFATGEKSLGEAVFDTLSPVSAADAQYLQETGAAMYSDYVDAGARNVEESRGMNDFDTNTGNDAWVKVTLPDGRVRNLRREDAKQDGYID